MRAISTKSIPTPKPEADARPPPESVPPGITGKSGNCGAEDDEGVLK
jgi:hypothetical protein